MALLWLVLWRRWLLLLLLLLWLLLLLVLMLLLVLLVISIPIVVYSVGDTAEVRGHDDVGTARRRDAGYAAAATAADATTIM